MAGSTGESPRQLVMLMGVLRSLTDQMDGTTVDANDVADLAVTVVSAQVQPPAAENQFPSWHNFTELTSITYGRPGGHRG